MRFLRRIVKRTAAVVGRPTGVALLGFTLLFLGLLIGFAALSFTALDRTRAAWGALVTGLAAALAGLAVLTRSST